MHMYLFNPLHSSSILSSTLQSLQSSSLICNHILSSFTHTCISSILFTHLQSYRPLFNLFNPLRQYSIIFSPPLHVHVSLQSYSLIFNPILPSSSPSISSILSANIQPYSLLLYTYMYLFNPIHSSSILSSLPRPLQSLQSSPLMFNHILSSFTRTCISSIPFFPL